MPYRLLLPLLLLAVALTAPAAAHARTGACLVGGGGPQCTLWTGKVVFVADGDTLDIDIDGDGTRTPLRVRLTGLNAMEQTRYSRYPSRRRGECHALAATRRLERIVKRGGNRVRVAAQDPRSKSGSRWRRSIAVKIGGRWRDPAKTLVAEGLALWLPAHEEWAWNAEYGRLADAAAQARRGLYDTDSCGAGPAQGADLSLTVRWDADGNDQENVNGEWIRVENRFGQAVDLGGWWVRDSHLRRYRFPSWASVPAGGAVRVRVGPGEAAGTEFHWGLDAPAFENADPSRGMGDGAYLFDPQGDLRAWQTYR
jgi:endonuclease YncB( thermonuclease family)